MSATDARQSKRPRKQTRGRRKKGYCPRQRNALYQLAAEFRRRHPDATAAEAWRHFTTIAATEAHDVALAHDPVTDILIYRPDPGRFDTREIRWRSFQQQFYRLGNFSA